MDTALNGKHPEKSLVSVVWPDMIDALNCEVSFILKMTPSKGLASGTQLYIYANKQLEPNF
jgi:hypothetical protein